MALYIKDCFDVEELGVANDKVECLWVRIRGKACRGNILVGICYRPPNQDKEMDEAFYEQLAEVARLPVLIFVGDFNFPDICWKYSAAQKKQRRRFLKCVEDAARKRAYQGRYPARPAVHKQRTDGRCGGWELFWIQRLQNCRVLNSW